MEPTPVTVDRPPVHVVRRPLALLNNKLTFERKLLPLKSPFNQPSSIRSSQANKVVLIANQSQTVRSSQANKVVLIANQSQHKQPENISSQEQTLLPPLRLSQPNNVVLTISPSQPEQSGNIFSQESSGPFISQSNAFKLPVMYSSGVGMDESNLSPVPVVRRPLALLNNKLTFERKLLPLKSPFNQSSSFRSSQANKVVLIANQSQHKQPENISSQEQALLPPLRLSQSNNVVLTISPSQPEQSGNIFSQESSGPFISQSNAFKLPLVHSSGVGMDESNLQQNWSANKDTAAEEIKASKHFKPMKDIVARAKEHQSKKSKSNPAPVRDKIIRNKFEAPFKKPSVRSMNTSAVEMPKCLEDILPSCFEYVVTYFDLKEDGGFSTIVRTNVDDKDGALRWIDMFQETSLNDLRSHNTFKENSPRIIFKKVYRCHCDTRADEPGSKTKTPHTKHTVCPANLIITVKNQEMKRSGDAHLKTFPCEITLNYLHNHGIVRADSLRFRRPTPEVKEAFLELFKKGHSPSSALNSIKFDLQLKYGDDYYKHAANGAICPSYKWGYNLYYSTFRQKYGDASGDGMISSLADFVLEYNKSCGSECAKLAVEGSDVAVAICSPLMKRVHELLRSSGEITFVDSSGNMDFANTRVFIFNTASVAGGLPLGIVFTTSEATYPLTNAFKLLQDILPEKAFFGRGKDGPKIFMTDDSQTERSSLRATFKASDLVLLLCKFHVLQAIWRFLLDSNHEVKGSDRVELFFLYKQLLNCTDINEFKDMYEEFLKLTIVQRNRKFKEHIEKKRESAKEWAMAHRQNIMTRGHETNNYNEVCTKRIKEEILQRVKAYSMVQLFDFMTVSLDAYFKRKLADCLANRMTNYRSSRYFIDDSKLESLTATQLADDVFSVHNSESGKTYRVDLTVDLCSCPIGVNGKPCKHQYYVVKSFGRSSSQFLPINDPESKLILHQIMNGSCSDIPEGWYESHKTSVNHGTNTSEDTLEQETENQPMQEEDREETSNPLNVGLSGASPNNDEESRLSKLRHEIDKMHEDMLRRLDERPEVYLPAMEKFMERYEECSQSENSYLSGLFTFNRSRNQGHAPLKGWAMKRIPVQPTAVGRRTTYLGGRHAKIPGRPSAAFKAANALKRRALEPNYANLPQKKRRLKHNISKNVLRNVPLSQLN